MRILSNLYPLTVGRKHQEDASPQSKGYALCNDMETENEYPPFLSSLHWSLCCWTLFLLPNAYSSKNSSFSLLRYGWRSFSKQGEKDRAKHNIYQSERSTRTALDTFFAVFVNGFGHATKMAADL